MYSFNLCLFGVVCLIADKKTNIGDCIFFSVSFPPPLIESCGNLRFQFYSNYFTFVKAIRIIAVFY